MVPAACLYATVARVRSWRFSVSYFRFPNFPLLLLVTPQEKHVTVGNQVSFIIIVLFMCMMQPEVEMYSVCREKVRVASFQVDVWQGRECSFRKTQ